MYIFSLNYKRSAVSVAFVHSLFVIMAVCRHERRVVFLIVVAGESFDIMEMFSFL